MKVAVVGHIEWGRFAKVPSVPKNGEIVHAADYWEEVAGGGSVAAMQLAQLNDSCLFFTAIGNDDVGKKAIAQLEQNGVEVHARVDDAQPTRSIFVHIDAQNERTITVAGSLAPTGSDTQLPWDKLKDMDAVYFASGGATALQLARQAKILVSTARILPLLQTTGIQLDALVTSSKDSGEVYHPGDLSPAPKLVVTTNGIKGGSADNGSTYNAEVIPAEELVDTYGCGDSFAAGLTFALGQGLGVDEALKLAAACGAEAAKRRGAFGN